MGEMEVRDGLVCMIGTDHALAPADVRSVLVLPDDVREAVVSLARVKLGASGVVLLATCNRTELWISFDGVEPPVRSIDDQGTPRPDDAVLQAFCDMYMAEPKDYAQYLVCRSGDDAVAHLFHVACGLRSAIMAEDQIVSQVKQAVAYAREIGVVDSVLEVLFRQAVTAAKRVKSGVRFTRAYATAIDQAIDEMERAGVRLSREKCMVIGNGEYGRLASSALAERGAKVFVTVRQYTHGAVKVPQGCTGVPYADRYKYIKRCGVVMSATTSPHYTLDLDRLLDIWDGDRLIRFFDLAIPRDIDPDIVKLPGCILRTIDDFSSEVGSENAQAIISARRILESGMEEFWNWMDRRAVMAQTKPPAALFPLFFDISEKHVVFIGGGTVALRRVRTLMPFVDDITIYAPDFSPELERFAADGAVSLVQRAYAPDALDGADLVFACTGERELNEKVWSECKRRGIPVNVSSDRFKCDFHFPGVAAHEGMVVGISAGGKDHRRVRQLRARIERIMEEEDI